MIKSNLKKILKLRHLTAKALAERINKNRGDIYNFTNSSTSYNNKIANRICRYLNININQLFTSTAECPKLIVNMFQIFNARFPKFTLLINKYRPRKRKSAKKFVFQANIKCPFADSANKYQRTPDFLDLFINIIKYKNIIIIGFKNNPKIIEPGLISIYMSNPLALKEMAIEVMAHCKYYINYMNNANQYVQTHFNKAANSIFNNVDIYNPDTIDDIGLTNINQIKEDFSTNPKKKYKVFVMPITFTTNVKISTMFDQTSQKKLHVYPYLNNYDLASCEFNINKSKVSKPKENSITNTMIMNEFNPKFLNNFNNKDNYIDISLDLRN